MLNSVRMSRTKIMFGFALAAASAMASPVSLADSTGYTGIFGGGPIYKNPSRTISELGSSGFNEVIVWSVEVLANGDLNFNGEFPLVDRKSVV